MNYIKNTGTSLLTIAFIALFVHINSLNAASADRLSGVYATTGVTGTVVPTQADIILTTNKEAVVGEAVQICVDTMPGFLAANKIICLQSDGIDISMVVIDGTKYGVGGSTSGALVEFPICITHTFTAPGTYPITIECAGLSPVALTSPKLPFSKAITGIPLGALTVGAGIPTLSQWGLIILGIFFLIFGIVAIRERAIQLK